MSFAHTHVVQLLLPLVRYAAAAAAHAWSADASATRPLCREPAKPSFELLGAA